MQQGQESRTAVMVCMARAIAHATGQLSDPTALALLPEPARRTVERLHGGEPPSSLRERMEREFVDRRAKMMVARTIEIDHAIRTAAAPQVVILGAGLDGKTWRMHELAHATVFEVDHPDSQREKRRRAAALTPTAREVRFVAVDFARDDLEAALGSAGHDATQPTTWVWEGVVMYLERRAIEATLAIIQRRSAAHSRLIVAYIRSTILQRLTGIVVRRIGEPFRSVFTRDQMAALQARFGFGVVSDRDVPTIAGSLSAELGRATRAMNHLRIATADRLDRGAA
ncbi:MAG: class I SAM-dependent methyltransferase [Kofleriaceae bacterium]